MADALSAETRDAVLMEVRGLTRETNPYCPERPVICPPWLSSEVA
jgi:hypothetical protein